MDEIGLVSRLLLLGVVLTACLAATGVAVGAAETAENETAHGSDGGGGHETTTVSTDESVSGFTLGAGLVAVLVGGAYQLING
ncbi:hypothetical protein ACFR9U_16400 [Halorientalis brevis]|uniref:Uncharacterized protein n=1 Tax=Halorientalis brevis TaxID=1126241 RepID=A0ABD6CEF9_9EURY|nr:hypothetical protein [Halorientalis brevis]